MSRVRSGSDILLVTEEDATAEAIKSALDESGDMALAGVCQEVSKLRSHLSSTKVRAVVVDIDPDPSRVLYELGPILTAYPEVYFVVVCSSFSKKLVVQAMQAGARHFLEKENIASELCEELHSLVHDGARKGTGLGSSVI
jgi:DNA-binding NarL/FixJ family response regulator